MCKIKLMTNTDIIKILEEIGKMKEVLGENQFSVIAYERVTRVLRGIGKSLEDVHKEQGIKGLEEISGIGPSIAGHIEELIIKGKCKEYENLKKKVPRAILDFLEIPGVGVKTAQRLYEATKAKDVKELKKRIRNQEPASPAGRSGIREEFGEKTLKNILRGIEILKKQTKRMTLGEADLIAKEVVEQVNQITAVIKVEAVGSLRRRQDTVGDIDVVCSSKNPQRVVEEFVKLPFAGKVINRGSTKATIIHKASGRDIDLEVLPPENYGSLLHHFTGSKDHNVHLRTWAEEKGLSISEYGIKKSQPKAGPPKHAPQIEDEVPFAVRAEAEKPQLEIQEFSTEKEFFQFLKMDYIPPELREDRGEIEAALKRKLPKLVELKDIKGDLQMHTTSSDGENSLEEMIKAAMEKGYQYIAITDHSSGLGIAGGQNEKNQLKQKQEIGKINEKFRKTGKSFRILSGVEANIAANGELDVNLEILSRLDLVIASIHSGFNQDREIITQRIVRALENPFVNVLAHPIGRLIPRRPSYEADWDKIFSTAVKNKVAIEINSFPNRLDLPDFLVKMAKEKYGLKFVINTDAHQVSHLNLMGYGVDVARRGWLGCYDIINAWDLKTLNKFLSK